jgi:hypothetical protein
LINMAVTVTLPDGVWATVVASVVRTQWCSMWLYAASIQWPRVHVGISVNDGFAWVGVGAVWKLCCLKVVALCAMISRVVPA